jgi:hypothetical protein
MDSNEEERKMKEDNKRFDSTAEKDFMMPAYKNADRLMIHDGFC